jgi:hypothetical protein
MGTRGSFLGGKAAEAWSWPLTSIYCRGLTISGAIPPLPPYAIMAWCSVKAQGKLYLLLWLFTLTSRKSARLYGLVTCDSIVTAIIQIPALYKVRWIVTREGHLFLDVFMAFVWTRWGKVCNLTLMQSVFGRGWIPCKHSMSWSSGVTPLLVGNCEQVHEARGMLLHVNLIKLAWQATSKF